MSKKLVLFLLMTPVWAFANCQTSDIITVPENQQAMGFVYAKGEQIYQCSLNQNQYTWDLKEPNALLFDKQGHQVGQHSVGPSWQFNSGSRIVGRMVKKWDVNPDKNIPWLLIEVTEHKGKDFLSETQFITRINTQGGLPPISACDGNHLGSEKHIPYTADYVFYKKHR